MVSTDGRHLFSANSFSFDLKASVVIPSTVPKTTICIPEAGIKAVLDIINRLPGAYEPDYPITLNASDRALILQGRNKDQQQPSCVPVTDVAAIWE